MSDGDELDTFIDAGAKLLRIDIRPEWRVSIRMHLAISLAHAKAVDDFPLTDEADPAPVFSA